MTAIAVAEQEPRYTAAHSLLQKKNLILPLIAGTIAVGGALEVVRSARTLIVEKHRIGESRSDLTDTKELSPLEFGISPDRNSVAEIALLSDVTGMEFSIANYFLDDHVLYWNDLSRWITTVSSAGTQPMISWGRPGDLFTEGLTQAEAQRRANQRTFAMIGQETPTFEAEMREFAGRLRDTQVPILFRPYYEMNGDWFSFGTRNVTPEQFRAAWIRLHTIFQEEHATNVSFVFSPNTTVYAQEFWSYYPGDAYVSRLSLDIYDKSNRDWRDVVGYYVQLKLSAEAVIGPDLQQLMALSPDKEIIITELGALENEAFMVEAIAYISQFDRVTSIMFFAWRKSGAGETDWHRELIQIPLDTLRANTRVNASLREEVFLRKFLSTHFGKELKKSNKDLSSSIQRYLYIREKFHPYQGHSRTKNHQKPFPTRENHHAGMQRAPNHDLPHQGIVYRSASSHPWKKVG